MGFKTGSDENDAVSEINVTPLVDVMLVLVIILLVTAPLLTQSVKVTLPKTAATTPDSQKQLLQLGIMGTACGPDTKAVINLNKTAINDLETLETSLKHELEQNPEVVVHVLADQTVNYGKVADVVATIKHAGISKIAFVKKEQ